MDQVCENRIEIALRAGVENTEVEPERMGRGQRLAVFKLMTSSKVVGCCTGRLAGFSPLRMRPA
jgi:hypothetical protein